MRVKWEPKFSEAIPEAISEREYRQRLAEIGKILYNYFRQLETNEALSIEPDSEATAENRRTGTDG